MCVCVCALVIQLCLTLCDPMDCSLPGSFVHGILQARLLKWVAISFTRVSSRPRDWTWVSHIVGRLFYTPIKVKKKKIMPSKTKAVCLRKQDNYICGAKNRIPWCPISFQPKCIIFAIYMKSSFETSSENYI